MKLAIKGLVIIGLVVLAQQVLPWWVIAIIPFVVEAAYPMKRYAFFLGFYSVFTLWLVQALLIDWQTGSILSGKVAAIFSFPPWPWVSVLLTGIIGGIVGGLSSLTGNYFRAAFFND